MLGFWIPDRAFLGEKRTDKRDFGQAQGPAPTADVQSIIKVNGVV